MLDAAQPLLDRFSPAAVFAAVGPEKGCELLVVALDLLVALSGLDSRTLCWAGDGLKGVHDSNVARDDKVSTENKSTEYLVIVWLRILSIPLPLTLKTTFYEYPDLAGDCALFGLGALADALFQLRSKPYLHPIAFRSLHAHNNITSVFACQQKMRKLLIFFLDGV